MKPDGEAESLSEQEEYQRGVGLAVPLPSLRTGPTVALTGSPPLDAGGQQSEAV